MVNKVDREFADPAGVHDKVLELFLDLDASEDQFESPFLYGSAKEGYFVRQVEDDRDGVIPLLEAIVVNIAPPRVDEGAAFRMLASNIDWDDYVGRVAIGKVLSGQVSKGDRIWRIARNG